MAWKLSFYQLIRYWRFNLVLLIIMILGAALVSSLPMLAVSIAGESLVKSMENTPVYERNILIQGRSRTDQPPEAIDTVLGGLVKEIISVREGSVIGYSVIQKAIGEDVNLYPATVVLNMHSFDRFDERVQVLQGRLPEKGARTESGDPTLIYEVAIGQDVSRRVGLDLGDVISPAGGTFELEIVGVVEPVDPTSEAWWGDRQMSVFSAWRRIYTSPDIDEWNISLFVHPQTMISRIYHNHYWRVSLDHNQITTSSAPRVREEITGLQSLLSEENLILSTKLIDLIADFEEALAMARISLLILTIQSLIAFFYLLGMFGNFLVERSQKDLATLAGRGFSRVLITGIFARTTAILAVAAGAVAPLAALGFLKLWTRMGDYPEPNIIPPDSWWLAWGTGFFSWLFLIAAIYRAAHPDIMRGQGRDVRTVDYDLTKRHIIWDLFFLVVGGLGYWQLIQGAAITSENSSPSITSATGNYDLVLLLGPSLLLLAIGLIMVRLLPNLWRLLARVSQRGKGLTWNLLFTRLARQPVGPSQITLLISLTVGLTIFAASFTTSLEKWQTSVARYAVGADIRLLHPKTQALDLSGLPDMPSSIQETEVIRTQATLRIDEFQRYDFDVMAVDPATFPNVISFPEGVSNFTVSQIMGVLNPKSPSILPVVLASSVQTNHLNVGDPVQLEVGETIYPAEVAGIIINFPLLEDFFVITDLAQFIETVDLETLYLTGDISHEIWLQVDPAESETLMSQLISAGYEDLIAGNAQTQLDIFRNNLVFREVATAFELNALVLIPLSVVGIFVIQFFSAKRRVGIFNILRALGLSKSERNRILLIEGVFFICLGTLLGIGIGYGLVYMMEPLLGQILPALSGDVIFKQVEVNWSEVGPRLVFLCVSYTIGLLVLVISTNFKQRQNNLENIGQ